MKWDNCTSGHYFGNLAGTLRESSSPPAAVKTNPKWKYPARVVNELPGILAFSESTVISFRTVGMPCSSLVEWIWYVIDLQGRILPLWNAAEFPLVEWIFQAEVSFTCLGIDSPLMTDTHHSRDEAVVCLGEDRLWSAGWVSGSWCASCVQQLPGAEPHSAHFFSNQWLTECKDVSV